MFAKKKKSQNLRKRKLEDDEEKGDEKGAVVAPAMRARDKKEKHFVTATAKAEKLDIHQFDAELKGVGAGVRNRAEAPDVVIDDTDQREAFERNKQLREQKEKMDGEGKNLYLGQAAYKQYVEKRDQSYSAHKRAGIGPAKAPTNVRVTCRFDYQPDICKDYKETGFCSFGDSCKFMHDRSDYKSGWQLAQEWEKEQEMARQKLEAGSDEESDDDDDDEFPFACHICRKYYTKPIVTKCKHYFCEKCAFDQFAKSSRCAICGEETHGIFNKAVDLIKNLEKRKEKGTLPPLPTSDDEEEEDEE
mmetsp:Transcript_7871/g.20486  ORF Transcript_7871/g.20486 Transcript_7871/m.20486 type:complete len:303 (-) Transcript_7871:580-1488(-)|eukprot:CAMPEP_0113894528 /NCGR_PEP_ID=MMETSP0780_2-20120614/16783_1 /TAXON_ID=652834 /ORGANISM="Palpitomonas bilix" /LENGTH=302 /DNA_ID=CAMNT_0000885109 /DNA_START=167 /DNA_END=1075 /DNA_ORIENTATION=+ /assembly_acc=CAM_ASM_000599